MRSVTASGSLVEGRSCSRTSSTRWTSRESSLTLPGPADALTVVVCGGLGVTTREWEVIDHMEVDPTAWPVPEFQRSVPTPETEQLLVVTKTPDLLNDAALDRPTSQI